MSVNEKYFDKIDRHVERPSLDFLGDVGFIDELSQNFGNEILPKVLYYSLRWEKSKPTNIYSENDEKLYLKPILIAMNAELNPPEKELDKFGIQHSRAIKFSVSMSELKKNNVLPKIGDQIRYDDDFFYVNDVKKESAWAASLQYVSVALFCDYTFVQDDPKYEEE